MPLIWPSSHTPKHPGKFLATGCLKPNFGTSRALAETDTSILDNGYYPLVGSPPTAHGEAFLCVGWTANNDTWTYYWTVLWLIWSFVSHVHTNYLFVICCYVWLLTFICHKHRLKLNCKKRLIRNERVNPYVFDEDSSSFHVLNLCVIQRGEGSISQALLY